MKIKSTILGSSLRPDPVDDRDYKFSSIPDSDRIVKAAAVLPVKYSWTSEMSSVKYQGELGSCVAFAVCALKEWQEKVEHEAEVEAGKLDNRRNKEYNLSEQWRIGVPLEKAWPYKDDPVKIGEPQRWAHLIARWSTIDSYWRVDDSVIGVKRALTESPVLLGMKCFEEIYGILVNGRVPMPAKPDDILTYHAVLAVGFNDEDQTICIKNSWSKFWGAGGYGYLPYQYVDKYCWDAWMVKDISVTPDMLKGTRKLIG